MSKAVWSILILVLTVALSILFYILVWDAYPTFGTFENLVFLGLVTFFLAAGVWLAAWLFEKHAREKKAQAAANN
jgi:quinol-cytochrome oxidoreductase complex cytochrome b subunit